MIEKFLIGGYTKRGGAGIYAASFDPDTATVTTPQPYITSLGSPTYLAVAVAKRCTPSRPATAWAASPVLP